jgi:methylphosphotriester-DNA--protein-cysteine methyltransferase
MRNLVEVVCPVANYRKCLRCRCRLQSQIVEAEAVRTVGAILRFDDRGPRT